MKRQKKNFQELKEKFTKELVLAVPNLEKMRIKVNVLDYVIDGILSIGCDNG